MRAQHRRGATAFGKAVPSRAGRRARCARCRAASSDDEREQQQRRRQQKGLIVTYKPKEREAAPAPEEAPIIHSSSYILSERQGRGAAASAPSAHADPAQRSVVRKSADEESGNAIQWALRQADSYFDRVETDAAANKSARNVVSNPVTQSTLRTLQGVTSFGAAAAPHVLRAAVPVGKKVLSATASTVFAAGGAFNDASRKRRLQQKERAARAREMEDGGDAGDGKGDAGNGARR